MKISILNMNDMQHRLLILATIILTSCSTQLQTTESPSSDTEVVPATVTPSSTIAPVIATSTPETDLSLLSFNCVTMLDSIQAYKDLDGALVLESLPSTLFKLRTKETIELGSKDLTITSLIVSPDRNKLAITYSGKNIVTLVDSNGSVIDEIDNYDANSLDAKYWLDSTHIVLLDWESTITNPYPSIILDINDHSWKVLDPEFDDINRSPDGNGREWYPTGGLTRLSINPQLTYLVYPSYKYQESLSELVIWDLQKSVVITRLHIDLSNTFPWWSPNGARFVTGGFWEINEQYPDLPYAGGGELVSVDISGEITRLSYYTTKYTAIPYYYVWSPDGEKIAFWMEILDSNNPEPRGNRHPHALATVDISTGKTINYCIQGLDYPVWSPDGKYIAVRASHLENPTYEEVRDVYIIDINEKTAVKVTDSGFQAVVGWMNTQE